MLRHPTDPGLALAEPAELARPALPPPFAGHESALRTIASWTRDYLCRPHPELGRRGPVCPFVRGALDQGSILLAVCPGERVERPRALSVMRAYLDWFGAFPARDRLLSFLVLFPEIAPDAVTDVIEGTQQALKPECVARGLMIGEFHGGPPAAPGLWNERFRPLRSPVPLLAIRRMVRTDLPFLRDDPRFLASYGSRFGTVEPSPA